MEGPIDCNRLRVIEWPAQPSTSLLVSFTIRLICRLYFVCLLVQFIRGFMMNIRLGEKVTVHEYKGQLRVFTINRKGVLEYHGVMTSVCLSNAIRKNSHTIEGVLEGYGLGDSHSVAIPAVYVKEFFPMIGKDDGFGLIGDFVDGSKIGVSEYHILYDNKEYDGLDCFLGVSVDDN